jgi:DNA polymerase III epsilon subunit-like protein
MRVLVIDTETTGLPEKGKGLNPETYPFIVQWSFVLVDTDTNHFQEHDYIMKVDVPIPTTYIHGISEGRSEKCGFSFPDIFGIFDVCLQQADIVVGHNLEFDLNMIRVECMRHAIPFDDQAFFQYCTMKRSKERCNIISEKGFVKFPKLSELYHQLFGTTPEELHNSLTDVYACLRCFYMLQLKRDAPSKIISRIK